MVLNVNGYLVAINQAGFIAVADAKTGIMYKTPSAVGKSKKRAAEIRATASSLRTALLSKTVDATDITIHLDGQKRLVLYYLGRRAIYVQSRISQVLPQVAAEVARNIINAVKEAHDPKQIQRLKTKIATVFGYNLKYNRLMAFNSQLSMDVLAHLHVRELELSVA